MPGGVAVRSRLFPGLRQRGVRGGGMGGGGWRAGVGGICRVTGVGRDKSRGHSVTHLEYEAYADMAKAEMRKIADEIAGKWPEARVAMAHRTGRLEIGEASVV